MALAFEPPDCGYIAYIDEAGDPGLTKVRPIDPDGATEWLTLGAVVIKAERETETVGWVRDIREAIRMRQKPDLHYRGLAADRKRKACEMLAELPLRCFALLSNKKNMRSYRNRRAEAARASSQEWFYNFCVRLILERITDYVELRSMKDHGRPKHLRLVFSHRGGLRYSQMTAYHDLLNNQARSGTTYLKKREVKWRVLHPRLCKSVSHSKSAGAQLADIVASSFYQAADALGPGQWDTQFAELLKPRIPTSRGLHADYGVTLMPTPAWKATLTPDQKKIFRFYGYQL